MRQSLIRGGRAALAGLALTLAGTVAATPLYTEGGKPVTDKDLSPALRQALHDLEHETYLRRKHFVDSAILEAHIEAEAKRRNVPREKVEEDLFAVKEPTEKDAKKWFDDNKDRMPPHFTFDQIKGDIQKLLKGERQKEKRDQVIADLKKKKKIELAFTEPVPPVFDINVEGFPVRGNPSAKVTLVEFADYQCPHCQAASKMIKGLLKKHGDKVKLVFVDFPINRSGISKAVAEGAYCAGEQGKYWEYHDLAFTRQKDLKMESPMELAKELKLDEGKFKACYDGAKPKEVVARGKAEGERLGISGTPTIFLNGRKVHGHTEEELDGEIKEALKRASS